MKPEHRALKTASGSNQNKPMLSIIIPARGFKILQSFARFLPYTMAGKKPVPLVFIRAFLKLPFAWKILGHPFLVIAQK
jgi:hypothetical protein